MTQLRFLNKLPEYVLVIQLVQDRASRLCSVLYSLDCMFDFEQFCRVIVWRREDLKRDLASS